MWTMKRLDLDWTRGSDQTIKELDFLDEFRLKAFESSITYKHKMKRHHDQRVENQEFSICDLVLLFNSRLHLFLGKLKSKWIGSFLITKVFLDGIVELEK